MNKLIVLSMFFALITKLSYAQSIKKDSNDIILVEEFTVENYTTPKDIMFYSSGHYEYDYFYEEVFKAIKKKTKKTDVKVDFIFQNVPNWIQKVQFYNKSEFESVDDKSQIVCFYEHDRINPEIAGYCHDGKCEFYFYVTLVDLKNSQVLLKRKYEVHTKKYYYTKCDKLADEIIKELQLKL
jgi:hypothetical protein